MEGAAYQVVVNVDTTSHLRVDVFVMSRVKNGEAEGFAVAVDGVHHAAAKNVDALKTVLNEVVDQAFKAFRKEASGTT